MKTSYLFLALICSYLSAQTIELPVRQPADPGVVTTGQKITPAGVPTVFQGRVFGVTFGANSSDIWVLNATHLYHLGWKDNRVISSVAHHSTPGLQAIKYDTAAGVAVFAGAKAKAAKVSLMTSEGKTVKDVAPGLGQHITGPPGFGRGKTVLPLIADNRVAVLDSASGKLLGNVATEIAPFGAVVNKAGTIAWVSNWGGRIPRPKDLTAPTGLAKEADRVVIDDRGVASTGTVVRIDLETLKVTHNIGVGLHPTALAWDEASSKLYVANSNQDSISVIDTAKARVTRTIPLKPFSKVVAGIAPTALALSPDGKRLWIACGGINAIAQMDTASGQIEGLIPTAWYPNSLALSADGKYLAISALLGAGSGWRDEPKQKFVHAYRGSVAVLELPGTAQLAAWTTAVAENNRMPLVEVAQSQAKPDPKAVPLRAGDPSLIEHVVYIVKENRTYDQVLGDLPKGNGDPSLVMFGEDVSPNHHRLATDFVLLDNFYATGGNSADGHQWLTQANETAYCLWPGYRGRSYPFDGTDPIAISSSGSLWDYALAREKSVKVYGEYAPRVSEPSKQRMELLRAQQRGEDFSKRWNLSSPIPALDKILARNYPSYSNSIPDGIRADIFLKDLAEWERRKKMPNLTIIAINCDHTLGTSPGVSTPKAMVADNDLALGRIVEALSKSSFWKKMAIFVVEDDAQNGVDHVDGHRTVALAVSPYTRRGAVDSTFYSHQSMLKTMELMLGLPTMSLFDLIATEMRNSFTDQPNFAPYTHVRPQQDLFEVNPPASALKGEARRAALASEHMRWDVPDAAPSDKLNRILWHATRGWDAKYPGVRQAVFSPLSLDVDDDDRD